MKKEWVVKTLAVGIVVLLIGISFILNTNAMTLSDKKSIEITKDSFNHFFCFVESGYVNHENVIISGFNLSYPFSFCIGSIKLNLTAFHQQPEEIRLSIKHIFKTIYYEFNVSVTLKGFIGRIQPTGSVSAGFLKGFALFTQVTII